MSTTSAFITLHVSPDRAVLETTDGVHFHANTVSEALRLYAAFLEGSQPYAAVRVVDIVCVAIPVNSVVLEAVAVVKTLDSERTRYVTGWSSGLSSMELVGMAHTLVRQVESKVGTG